MIAHDATHIEGTFFAFLFSGFINVRSMLLMSQEKFGSYLALWTVDIIWLQALPTFGKAAFFDLKRNKYIVSISTGYYIEYASTEGTKGSMMATGHAWHCSFHLSRQMN